MNTVLLHLSLIPSVGPVLVKKIHHVLSYDEFFELYNWSENDFKLKIGLSSSLCSRLVKGLQCRKVLDQELSLIDRHNVQWASIADQVYPELLKQIHAPPLILYWHGAPLKNRDLAVAVIGSRKANAYGKMAIDSIVPELVSAGCSIVSGGAIGADTMAHECALACGGKTLAIIGSGLCNPYPLSNRRLFERIIISGGSVVSCFPLMMQAFPGNFPARNRVISGMCNAVVVAQAAEKSGARTTALYALEQGREVCVVPGSIADPLSKGCHRLLSEGAALVQTGHDVLASCNILCKKALEEYSVIKKHEHEDLLVQCRTPQNFDDLLTFFEGNRALLQDRLMSLQLEGKIEQDFAGRWLLTPHFSGTLGV